MLYADKNALRTQLKVNMLRIRERELLFFTNNCLSISTSAALLAGFAWYGLTEVPFDLQANVVVQTLYLVVTTLIMGLELLTVVNATLCAILGPGLALRGPDGSMHNAVNGMMTHYKFTFACFTCGLLCFHISALLYAWMQFEWELAMPVSVLLMYFLWTVWRYFRRIVKRFQLQPGNVVTGAFNNGGAGGGGGQGGDGAGGGPAAPTAEQLAREQQEREEQARLQEQYASLPESVKASMGISSGGGGVGRGEAGPSGAGPSHM